MFLSQEQLDGFYHDEGERVLKPARDLAQASGVAVHAKIAVGELAPCIVRYAREQRCDLIVMGTRGMGSVANMLLGSVATKVIHLAECPVLLVK
jgi:nucleotide-binding universal stress UspA family protein